MCVQEQILLEPMFEAPGSDVTHITVEEDTARGYHPARYQTRNWDQNQLDESDQSSLAHHSNIDEVEKTEIKTSVI